ncbi:hypothetical protein N7495_005339 [Penicillium taxi]|uniref:uncharacterized protein n=1 Tax=Penicillium taxi TaxID=168475 RepID=UPI0025457C35|nr:uncharacterized protein N7495_005339 [Penicillium taxi]KAJ5893648.1 hypothetical protein N7495_005339 [Penicillium taxi]
MNQSTITPALQPPVGQTSNFIDPVSSGTKFLVINCIFLPLAFLALGIRTWTRIFVVRSFRMDDLLNWGLGKHMWDVPLTSVSPHFNKKYKLNLIAAIIYCAATGFTKCSVLVFYLRIFPSRKFHTAVWTLVFIAAGYSFASILANIFSCNPIAKSWDETIIGGTCINRPVFYFANAGLGIFTDFATSLASYIAITNATENRSRYHFSNGMLRWNRSTTNALMWCTIELNLGIVGGSVTAIRPFIKKYFPELLGSTKSYATSRSRKYGHPLGSTSAQASKQLNLTNRENRYTVTTLTTLRGPDNDSEEFILSNIKPEGQATDSGIIRTVTFDVKNTLEAESPL